MFLINDDEVKGKAPSIVTPIASDMDLEIYVVDSARGRRTYAKAVICVRTSKYTYRTKWDSGIVNSDDYGTPSQYAHKCLIYIRGSEAIEGARELGKQAYNNQRNSWERVSLQDILLIIAVLLGLFILWLSQKPRLDEVNKYNCAVLGYKADCKTPLPASERLK